MPRISPVSLVQNGECDDAPPTIDELRTEAQRAFWNAVRVVEERARSDGEVSFRDFERELRVLVFSMGRVLVVLFLALREQHVISQRATGRFESFGRTFRPAPPIARNLTTLFGVVRYWRAYMREVAERERHGFYPLDFSLGLTSDRFSWNVLAQAARLATELSFACAREILGEFMPNAPSTEVIEQTMLGLGAHTEAWFAMQSAPSDDGQVLIVEIDGKAVPTATERELARRRRKRSHRPKSGSPRHRGRHNRARHPKQPRRKKGDHAKNGKMISMLVIYTLRRRGRRLEGPLNRWHYASFGPKRHAFAIARREVNKRGFAPGNGRLVQVLTDGDNDYTDLVAEHFPEAIHTIDCYHVFQKLWDAGGAFLKEGSPALRSWVDEQKAAFFQDDVESVLAEMQRRWDAIALTGPGNKGRRQRLFEARRYLEKRIDKIRYGSLRRRDLVISTGIVEGAIKHIIAHRCDHGGMRWVKERAQAVVQLRCIEINGDWENFERFVHDRLCADARLSQSPRRLQAAIPQEIANAA